MPRLPHPHRGLREKEMTMSKRDKYLPISPGDYLKDEEELLSNPEPRLPMVICVDSSFSMRRDKRLDRLADGVRYLCFKLGRNMVARLSVEMCVLSFGGAQAGVYVEFAHPHQVARPVMIATGERPLADGVRTALDSLRHRLGRYEDTGVSWFTPWLVVLSSGDDTRSPELVETAAGELREWMDHRPLHTEFVAVGVPEEIRYRSLMRLAPGGVVRDLPDQYYVDFFRWLTVSALRITHTHVGEEAVLPEYPQGIPVHEGEPAEPPDGGEP